MKTIYFTDEQNKRMCEIFGVEYTPMEEHSFVVEGKVCRGELHPMYGLKHTKESKQKNSESIRKIMNSPKMKALNSKLQKVAQRKPEVIEKKKKGNEWRSKPIYGWHPEITNNSKVLYRSIRDFCQQTGTNRSVVSGILTGKYKQSFGWFCQYAK